jgi:hypothetical protein
MHMQASQDQSLSDARVKPLNSEHGALHKFCETFSSGSNLIKGNSWTMGELLGSVPDLRTDFEQHYRDLMYFVVPTEIVVTKPKIFERIKNKDLSWFDSPSEALDLIPGLSEAYLTPQMKSKYVILHYKRGGTDIGTYSISGRKYLQFAHIKGGRLLNPKQLIILYMGLFILGSLSRYMPEMWNPFVQSDATGERLIAEKFISVCARLFPNLVLNEIQDQRYQFVNETEGLINLENA